MKKLLPALLIICALCACDKRPPKTPKDQLPQGALAVVAGAPITQADFDEAAAAMDAEFADFLKTPAGRQNFLDFLINERMLRAAAVTNNIENSAQYKEEIARFHKEQEEALKARHDYLMYTLLIEKLQKDGIIAVSEDEIKDYYRKHPYQITLAHVLVEDAQKAAEVMREMANVRTQDTFARYARQHSIDGLTNKKGGVLPPFIPGEYLPEIEVPAANTPVGQTQGFFKTALGFHIIMKVKEESIPLTAAKDRIQDILEKQKMDAYLSKLKERYGVEVINNEVE